MERINVKSKKFHFKKNNPQKPIIPKLILVIQFHYIALKKDPYPSTDNNVNIEKNNKQMYSSN